MKQTPKTAESGEVWPIKQDFYFSLHNVFYVKYKMRCTGNFMALQLSTYSEMLFLLLCLPKSRSIILEHNGYI